MVLSHRFFWPIVSVYSAMHTLYAGTECIVQLISFLRGPQSVQAGAVYVDPAENTRALKIEYIRSCVADSGPFKSVFLQGRVDCLLNEPNNGSQNGAVIDDVYKIMRSSQPDILLPRVFLYRKRLVAMGCFLVYGSIGLCISNGSVLRIGAKATAFAVLIANGYAGYMRYREDYARVSALLVEQRLMHWYIEYTANKHDKALSVIQATLNMHSEKLDGVDKKITALREESQDNFSTVHAAMGTIQGTVNTVLAEITTERDVQQRFRDHTTSQLALLLDKR